MAVAGLHNVSILGENHSPVSRRWGGQDRSTNRTSTIRQIWRQLEGERSVSRFRDRGGQNRNGNDVPNDNFESPCWSEGRGSESDNGDSLGTADEVENECPQCPQGQIVMHTGHEHDNSSNLHLSPGFGEAERERVRQVFREWGNNASNISHWNNCSRAQWLGENERRRVRIVREWIEMTTQEGDNCHGSREEQAAEIGSQIERVRDGLVVSHSEIGALKAIRRLCGRQTLLDLLKKSERERKAELQGLLEHQLVSNFAHRNRIQSLLKGRFLRNGRFIQDERPTSLAASELGLLRERHTVSDLREGFLSRLDNHTQSPRGGAESDTLSNYDIDCHRSEETQANSLETVPDEISDEFEAAVRQSDVGAMADMESETCRGTCRQESMAQVEARQERELENWERVQIPVIAEFVERRNHDGEDAVEYCQESNVNGWSLDTSSIEGRVLGPLPEVHDILHEDQEPSVVEREAIEVSRQIDLLEANPLVEGFNWQEGSAQVEEWQESVTENDESGWHHLASLEFSEAVDVNSHASSNGWYQETAGNASQEPDEEWHQNDVENIENWVDEPFHLEVDPVGRTNAFDSFEEDTGYNLELRELMSRRRVSSLLQSGFRESLNQLIQSYVERQGHAFDEWVLDSVSPSPAFREEQEQEHQRGVDDIEAVESTELLLPSLPGTPHALWDQDSHEAANWQQPNMHQHLGVQEWEIINDLKIDMARLQQRMNDMQRMLEACMDMQLELQRSIRQEVSAALSRSSVSAEACGDCLLQNKAECNHLRKGACCICCASNVDSLPYSCGHMCMCSKCAEKRSF